MFAAKEGFEKQPKGLSMVFWRFDTSGIESVTLRV